VRDLRFRLLNDFQRDLPLVPRPFAELAARLDVTENRVLEMLTELQATGTVSRVGPVFRPNVIGASTLAAMAVPKPRLEEVARVVSARQEVNHNYAREHHFNLWFVANAATRPRLQKAIAEIAKQTGLQVLDLPMLEDYHIDLGFPLLSSERDRATRTAEPTRRAPSLSALDKTLIGRVQGGLPITAQPFAAIGARTELTEQEVIARLVSYLAHGVIKRFGVIVRHHELGYRSNAMVVWDLPDTEVRAVGERMARVEGVTLCYRRRRHLPQWPHNLYCMIHGRDRDSALERLARVKQVARLEHVPCEVLFSVRRFKQRGAMYVGAHDAAAA